MPVRSRRQQLARTLDRFRRHEGGFVLVFAAVALPALLALVGLAIDGAWLLMRDSDIAGEADAAALAAADRLDRSDEAIGHATAAATALTNEAGGRLTFRFGRTLAELRHDPTFTLSDADGSEAVFVEVVTAERSIGAGFLGLVGARPASVSRRATAESQYYACDVTPLMMCHRDPARFVATARRGRQYMLHADGSLDDGALVLLDPAENRNGRRAPLNLASDKPAVCLTHRLTPRRAFTPAEFDEAVNVRFDRYVTDAGPVALDLQAFPPAPIVVQGRRFATCASRPSGGDIVPPFPLPRDSGFRSARPGTAFDAGSGDWRTTSAFGGSGAARAANALDEYIAWNHADKPLIFQDDLRRSPSRFELYLKELGLTETTADRPVATNGGLAARTAPTGGPVSGPLAGQAERPVPRCFPDPSRATDALRRVLYVAIVDCRTPPDQLDAATLSARVAKFFITEPSERGSLLVEYVDLVVPLRHDGKLRHVVQLVDVQ